ncbi:ATP-dependent exoDNAse (exonuclease V) beta subunit (contains helicase and exonuclease domains) [Verrucomicrobium sp. GAS474]|uniref:UvrD-helicase domain-containing protein n=1 Tax=Verrucomicrobium sp. GAS474 TaxID=1882831 RepID=UPI00087B1A81|nr:UvrD-helicase domain-containing protein [Verrucomicrobium sp. GAS474]SDU20149.1 ATP-dependent exoDNAse (exonuclease V) beta subunit (contains helicase and exonuclease domains) [Verrucomicrobium sp. GAS474]
MNDRDRFLEELDANFSVRAAAGTGKTTSLVARIARIAERHPERLAKLVVVTYTHRAADEMRVRLRGDLLKQGGAAAHSPLVRHGLSQLFIGTIHAFCLKLVREYGLWIGYGAEITAEAHDDPRLLRDFEKSRQGQDGETAPAWRETVHRLVPARQVTALAKHLGEKSVDWGRFIAAPAFLEREAATAARLARLRLDPAALDDLTHKRADTQANIERWQRHWRALAASWEKGNGFVAVPKYDNKGGTELKDRWPEALAPWLDALLDGALLAAVREAAAFQEFRLRTGRLFFSDQIVLARRLFEEPSLRTLLLGEGYHLLLDEAQDTDPLQFEILVELSRPPGSAPFAWPGKPDSHSDRDAAAAPIPGRFIMVGDAQQAIYRDRATHALYLRYHEALVASPGGAELTFAETYRCRPGVTAFVNDRFPHVLDGRDGQTHFVPLVPARNDLPGATLRWRVPLPDSDSSIPLGNADEKTEWEARWLARRLKECGPRALGAPHWGEVALLCPARKWLAQCRQALLEEGLPVRLHTDRPRAERPEYLWLTALLTIHLEPTNAFEIVGVLRELYGIDDDLLFAYRHDTPGEKEKKKNPFTLRGRENGTPSLFDSIDPIGPLLDSLSRCREAAVDLPLAEAVALWVERTELRQRLLRLPGGEEEKANRLRGLDSLLLAAHAAQGEERDLRDFHRELLRGLDRNAPVWEGAAASEPRIELMTMKKAKGLQWNAVIIPFMGRGTVEGGQTDYPKLLCPPGVESPDDMGIAYSPTMKMTRARELDARDDAEETLERERLLYVAATRARYTLLWIDDEALWKEGKTRKQPRSGYEAIRGRSYPDPEANPLDLSAEALAETFTSPFPTEAEAALPAPRIDPWPAAPAAPLRLPALRGKKTPSQHDEVPLPPDPDGETPDLPLPIPTMKSSLLPRRPWAGQDEEGSEAIRYGLWWHDIVHRWPWIANADTRKIDAYCQAILAELPELPSTSPLRERGERELALFRASPLPARLAAVAAAGGLLQETPYSRLVPGEGGSVATVEDGILDLAWRDEAGLWHILDWKTDQAGPALPGNESHEKGVRGPDHFRQRYADQLQAYRLTLADLGLPVGTCSIYSTALGIEIAV